MWNDLDSWVWKKLQNGKELSPVFTFPLDQGSIYFAINQNSSSRFNMKPNMPVTQKKYLLVKDQNGLTKIFFLRFPWKKKYCYSLKTIKLNVRVTIQNLSKLVWFICYWSDFYTLHRNWPFLESFFFLELLDQQNQFFV